MKCKTSIMILLPLVISFGGCASGPSYQSLSSTIQEIPSNQGRVYIYRTTVFGGAIQPNILLDGQVIGQAKPKGFFYIDRPAGTYQISASTEAKRSLSLNLNPGEEKYVRLEVKMGLVVGHVKPVLVDNAVGKKQIMKTKYTGNK